MKSFCICGHPKQSHYIYGIKDGDACLETEDCKCINYEEEGKNTLNKLRKK